MASSNPTTTATVRVVFEVRGANVPTPAPIVSDLGALTVHRLFTHATSTLGPQPPACVRVDAEGNKDLDPSRPHVLVTVPKECVIRPPRRERPSGAKERDDDAEEEGDVKDQTKDKDATSDDEGDVPVAAAAAEEEGADSAPKAAETADAAAAAEGEAPTGAAAAAGETTDAAAKDDATKKKRDQNTNNKRTFKARAPPEPPRDMRVVVTVGAAPARLPPSRDGLLKPGAAGRVDVCASCGGCKLPSEAPVGYGERQSLLLDCGHIVCLNCDCCKTDIAQKRGNHSNENANNGDSAAAAEEEGSGEKDKQRRRGGRSGVASVRCPCCGFRTITNASFPTSSERTADGEGEEQEVTRQVLPEAFARSGHAAIAASQRTTACAVCKEADAIGRCSVELLSMCGRCHEEHLPAGPLRATHALLRFDGDKSLDAAAVLCEVSGHRNLPVTYLCVNHGKLGCHMCLRDTSAHEKCDVVATPEELASVARVLRQTREAESARAQNDAIAGTKGAWDAHQRLRDAYQKHRKEIDARAEAYKSAVEEQRAAAQARLDATFADSLRRWETRITALDAVRGRAAHVAAVLDGHRHLDASLLLHAEAAGHLALTPAAFADENAKSAVIALADPVSIQNLVVRFKADFPQLFDVNNSHPSVAAAAGGKNQQQQQQQQQPATTRATAVALQQAALGTVAAKWRSDLTHQQKKAAEAAAAQQHHLQQQQHHHGGGRKPLAAGLDRAVAKIAVALPKRVAAPSTDSSSEQGAGGAAAAATELGEGVSCVAAAAGGHLFLVEPRRNTVLVASLGRGAANPPKVTHVLQSPVNGGGDGANKHSDETLPFEGPDGTVNVPVRRDVDFRGPIHVTYHSKARRVVVCDTGNDRLVTYPLSAFAPPSAAKPSAAAAEASGETTGNEPTPAAAVAAAAADDNSASIKLGNGAPLATAADPATGGLILFEKNRFLILPSFEGNGPATGHRYPGLIMKGAHRTAGLQVAVTPHQARGIMAIIRATGDVSFLAAGGSREHLGDWIDGHLVDPATAKARRGGGPVPTTPVAAIAAHPEQNYVVLATLPADGAWNVTLTAVGVEDEPAAAAAVPAPAPATQKGQQQRQGGKQQQQAAPPPPRAVPTLRVLRSKTVELESVLPRTACDSSFQIVGLTFETPQRLLVAVREVSSVQSPAGEEDGTVQLRQVKGGLRFVVVAL